MAEKSNATLLAGIISDIDSFIDGGMFLDWAVGGKKYTLSLSIEIDVDMKIMMVNGQYDSMITTYRRATLTKAAFADKIFLKQANKEFPEIQKPLAMILLGIQRRDSEFQKKVYQYLIQHAKARLE